MEKISSLTSVQEDNRVKAKVYFEGTREWKFVSRVLDRLFFIIFVTIAICFNIYLMASSPFTKTFDFCPEGEDCEGLTEEEVRKLISDIAHHAKSGGDHGGGHGEKGGGGGHGAADSGKGGH